MMKHLTYGDKPGTFYLQTCLNKISEDTTISPETKNFICNNYYVDDGATSKPTIEEIEIISNELPIVFEKYSFEVKHIITIYKENTELKSKLPVERLHHKDRIQSLLSSRSRRLSTSRIGRCSHGPESQNHHLHLREGDGTLPGEES